MKSFDLMSLSILMASPFLSAQAASMQEIGNIQSLSAGDVACYVEFIGDDGKIYHEMASFEICEQSGLINKKVKFSYTQGNVIADSCEGNPDCQDSKTVWLINKVSPTEVSE